MIKNNKPKYIPKKIRCPYCTHGYTNSIDKKIYLIECTQCDGTGTLTIYNNLI